MWTSLFLAPIDFPGDDRTSRCSCTFGALVANHRERGSVEDSILQRCPACSSLFLHIPTEKTTAFFLPPRLYQANRQEYTRVNSQEMCFSLMLPFVVYSRCVGGDLETYEVFSPELRREACASALRMLVTNNADNQAMIRKAGHWWAVFDGFIWHGSMPGSSGPCWGHPSISPIAAGWSAPWIVSWCVSTAGFVNGNKRRGHHRMDWVNGLESREAENIDLGQARTTQKKINKKIQTSLSSNHRSETYVPPELHKEDVNIVMATCHPTRPSVRDEAAAALGNLVFFNDETNAGNQAGRAFPAFEFLDLEISHSFFMSKPQMRRYIYIYYIILYYIIFLKISWKLDT